MESKIYTARKLKPQGKESWVMEFRHPRMKDLSGKLGKKIRKGLGTKNENGAQELVNEMNSILSDTKLWEPAARQIAINKFNPLIVDAFYDGIDYLLKDYEKIREEVLPINTKKGEYTRAMLLGATGAGKTTLLRQLMGTDPISERFPATSASRTTVFETEIILSPGNYKGVVTFYSENETRQLIVDSVKNAMIEHFSRNDDAHTLRVLLEDKDQRFRLSYILGKMRDDKKFSKYEDDGDEDDAITDIKVSEDEQRVSEGKIQKYLASIKAITNKIIEKDNKEYRSSTELSDDDKKILEEIVLADIMDYEDDDVLNLSEEILDEIKLRFGKLNISKLVTEKFGWPIYWYSEQVNRDEFIKEIKYFSSNAANMFGKLLTPLVSGMRIEGPFKPAFLSEIPKLVIYDGEGLGHIPDTSTNLPAKTIKKFSSADAIILVDDSQSPMLASSYAAIKSVAISGHSQKLFLCFTHFDAVRGDNLRSIAAKTEHIWGSVDNLLQNLEKDLSYDVKKFFIEHLHNFSYYLGNLDEELTSSKKHQFTIDQIRELIMSLEKTILAPNTSLAPSYDMSSLFYKIRKAATDFHSKWDGHLHGFNGIKKQHFTRIKALTNRLGYRAEYEYNDLRPVPDFWGYFNGQISNFLATPISWNLTNPPEAEKQASINLIKQEIESGIFNYAISSIKNSKMGDWQFANSFSGLGSSYKRAEHVSGIYDEAVPIPEDDMSEMSKRFLADIMSIIKNAVEKQGGKITTIFSSLN